MAQIGLKIIQLNHLLTHSFFQNIVTKITTQTRNKFLKISPSLIT